MEKSQSIINLSKALLQFQGKVDKIKKQAENPFFKSKYASLSNIQDTIQLPLMECGLTYVQLPESDDTLTTILIHAETGEYLQSSYNIKPVKTDPQALGSAITYAKRYAIVAILALNIDDDDDGNAATGNRSVSESKSATTDNAKWLNPDTIEWTEAIKFLSTADGSIAKIEKKYKLSKVNKELLIKTAQNSIAA